MLVPVKMPAKVSVLAAAGGSQVSGVKREAGHGLFTYYLLRALRLAIDEKGRNVSLQDAFQFLRDKVESEARIDSREQSPQLMSSMPDIPLIGSGTKPWSAPKLPWLTLRPEPLRRQPESRALPPSYAKILPPVPEVPGASLMIYGVVYDLRTLSGVNSVRIEIIGDEVHAGAVTDEHGWYQLKVPRGSLVQPISMNVSQSRGYRQAMFAERARPLMFRSAVERKALADAATWKPYKIAIPSKVRLAELDFAVIPETWRPDRKVIQSNDLEDVSQIHWPVEHGVRIIDGSAR